MEKKRNWKEYNEKLVRRGEILISTDFSKMSENCINLSIFERNFSHLLIIYMHFEFKPYEIALFSITQS